MSQARYIAAGDGIAFEIVCDYRQLGRCRSRRFYGRTRCWNEYIRAELDKLASQLRKSVRFAVRPACFDFDGLAFDIAGLVEPLAKGIEDRRSGIWKSRMEKPDDRNLFAPVASASASIVAVQRPPGGR